MNSFLINPFEAIGKAHNAGLDFVAENLRETPMPTIDTIVDLCSKFVCSKFYRDGTYSELDIYSVNRLVSYGINHLSDLKPVYEEAKLSQEQIVFLERMVSVDPYMRLENQYDFFRSIEGEILSYPMTYGQKEILLVASAIGRYSSQYWNTQFENPDLSPWRTFLPNPDQPGTALKKKGIGKEDGKGAVAGGIAGSPLFGGPGILIGALGGAIGASVAALIFG